jgi:hypothetical protein
MGWLDACFSNLPNPRRGNAKRHDLLEVLTIALVASIRGGETCVDFADFARDRAALFQEFLNRTLPTFSGNTLKKPRSRHQPRPCNTADFA